MYKILVDGRMICNSQIDDLAVINPVVTLEANKAGSFVFTLPPNHPMYDSISRRKSVITVVIGAETLFEGICTSESTDFYKQKKITCEGDLTYLNDTIQRQAHYTGVSVLELLTSYISKHNEQVPDAKKFEVGNVTVTDPNNYISCYTNMNSTLEEIKSDLVDDLGGYIIVRHENGHRYIDYLSQPRRTSNQAIELGKNLMDYSSNIDNTDVATRIIPLGAKLDTQDVAGLDAYTTIRSVNSGVDYLESSLVDTYGVITKVVNWDNVSTPSILKSKAQTYLNDIQFENVVIESSAIDMGMLSDSVNTFRLLDSVHVISQAHGMDKWMTVTKLTLNLNNPEKDRIKLGSNESLSLSAKTNKANTALKEQLDKIPTANSVIAQAVNNATNLIAGASGGYVKINDSDGDGEPDEILVMDHATEEEAVNLWRWNKNGFGFSSNGGTTYGTAITMDGHIVGTYIAINDLYALGATIGGWEITKDAIASNTNCSILDVSLVGDGDAHISELYVCGGMYKSTYGNGAVKENKYDEQGNIVGYEYTYTTERQTKIDEGSISMLCDSQYGGVTVQEYKYNQATPYGDYQACLGYYGLDVKKKNGGSYNSRISVGAGGVYFTCASGAFQVAENSDGKPIVTFPGYTMMGTQSVQTVPAQFTSTATFRGAVYNASGGVVFISDRDKKHDINEIDVDETSKFIYELTPCEFKYNDGTSDRFHHGLIAQDVKEAMGDDDWGLYVECEDGTKALRYDELIADLIATVQSQNKRIKELEEKING